MALEALTECSRLWKFQLRLKASGVTRVQSKIHSSRKFGTSVSFDLVPEGREQNGA